MKKPNGYWTLEKCKEDALNFNTKNLWQKKSSGAYNSARKNKWLKICCKHMISLGGNLKRVIYAFEFPDNSVYIGLTYNIKTRKKDHLNPSKNKKSTVYKYIRKINQKPKLKILTNFIDKDIASKLEGRFLEKYRKIGWKILNINKTGGLGGNTLKWTKEKCVEDGLKFKSRGDWKKNSPSAYATAVRKKWLYECTSHMNYINNKWDLYKVEVEALKYKTKKSWRENSMKSYNIAILNNWIDQCSKHMDILWEKKWNIDSCKENALMYKTKTDWSNKSNGAYECARKNNWLKICCEHMIKKPAWNKNLKSNA